MKLTEKQLKLFKKKLEDNECCYDSGIECSYWVIGGIGIKMYNNFYDRNRNYDWQKKAYKYRLAPFCDYKFKITYKLIDTNSCCRDKTVYCYLTENAKTIRNKKLKKKIVVSKLNYVFNKFKKKGLDMDDWHEGNIGKIGNRWVGIDFGYCRRIDKDENFNDQFIFGRER